MNALHELIHRLSHRLSAVERQQERIIDNQRIIMTALDTLNQSVTNLGTAMTALTGAVDTAITDLGSSAPTDAQLLTLSQTVDGLTSAIAAQTARLKAATAPPPSTPTPVPTPTPSS